MVLVKGETVDANSVYEENKLQNTERQRKYLQDLISRCEKLVPDNYTEESWNVFQEALLCKTSLGISNSNTGTVN